MQRGKDLRVGGQVETATNRTDGGLAGSDVETVNQQRGRWVGPFGFLDRYPHASLLQALAHPYPDLVDQWAIRNV